MAAKTNDASVKPGLVAPAVALAHLAWRPPALRLVQHLLVDRGPLTFSGLHRAESLVAWHDRQVRRYVPDPERNHPLLASNVEMARGPSFARDAAFDASRVEAEEFRAAAIPESPPRTAREPMPAPPRDDNAGEAIAAWQPPETPAVDHRDYDFGALRVNRGRPTRLRPVRAADLYFDSSAAAEDSQDRAASEAERPPALSQRDRDFDLKMPARRLEDDSPPRQDTSESAQSRRELSEAFPRVAAPSSGTYLAPPVWPTASRLAMPETTPSALQPMVGTADKGERQAILPPPRPADVSPTPVTQTAIEKLIERIREPVPVPGFEVRLVQPAERESAAQPKAAEPGDAAKTKAAPAPPPPATPPLDINAIADKVYKTLMRRDRLERERKGLH